MNIKEKFKSAVKKADERIEKVGDWWDTHKNVLVPVIVGGSGLLACAYIKGGCDAYKTTLNRLENDFKDRLDAMCYLTGFGDSITPEKADFLSQAEKLIETYGEDTVKEVIVEMRDL